MLHYRVRIFHSADSKEQIKPYLFIIMLSAEWNICTLLHCQDFLLRLYPHFAYTLNRESKNILHIMISCMWRVWDILMVLTQGTTALSTNWLWHLLLWEHGLILWPHVSCHIRIRCLLPKPHHQSHLGHFSCNQVWVLIWLLHTSFRALLRAKRFVNLQPSL